MLVAHHQVEATAQFLRSVFLVVEAIARVAVVEVDLGKPFETGDLFRGVDQFLDRLPKRLEDNDLFGLHPSDRGRQVLKTVRNLAELVVVTSLLLGGARLDDNASTSTANGGSLRGRLWEEEQR